MDFIYALDGNESSPKESYLHAFALLILIYESCRALARCRVALPINKRVSLCPMPVGDFVRSIIWHRSFES